MTCDEFKECLFKLQGPKETPEMMEAVQKHADSCKPCYEVFFRMLRNAVDKELERGDDLAQKR